MAPLLGLVKDPDPPATDTLVSPQVIPDGTTLITTLQHNKIIDYLSGDVVGNFIPQSAINNLATDLAAKEDSANKATNFTAPDNIKYPTTQAVQNELILKEDLANKAINLLLPDNTKYPTTQAVKTQLDLKENLANKAIDFLVLDNVKYPTTQAVKTELDLKEDLTNKATDFSAPDNTLYPTTLAVQTALDLKEDNLGFIPENPANKGIANGYAPLDSDIKVPLTHLGIASPTEINFLRDDGTFVNPQTPWNTNINADSKNLDDLGVVSFAVLPNTEIPANTIPFIMFTDDPDFPGVEEMIFNVPANKNFLFNIAAIPNMRISSGSVHFYESIIFDPRRIVLTSTTNPTDIEFRDTGVPSTGLIGEIKSNNTTTDPLFTKIEFIAENIDIDTEEGQINFSAASGGALKSYITINKDSLDQIDFNDVALIKVPFIGDLNGNEIVSFANTSTAINHAQFSNSDAGNDIELSAIGDDTDVSFKFIPKGAGTFYGTRETWAWPLTDEDTPPFTGIKYVTDPAPYDMVIEDAIAGLTVAGTGTALFTIDILKENTVNSNSFTSIFSTLITINAGQFTSTTASSSHVLSTTIWEKGTRLQLSIDTLDDNETARGAKVELICHATAK